MLQYATLQGVVESPVLPQREDAYEALFATWVERVLATAPKVAKAKERKGYEITKLPKDLGEDFVGEWKSRGWIEAIPGVPHHGEGAQGGWAARGAPLGVDGEGGLPLPPGAQEQGQGRGERGELPSEEAPVIIQKSTLWVREELAKELSPEALALGERKEVGGVAYYVFRLRGGPCPRPELRWGCAGSWCAPPWSWGRRGDKGRLSRPRKASLRWRRWRRGPS